MHFAGVEVKSEAGRWQVKLSSSSYLTAECFDHFPTIFVFFICMYVVEYHGYLELLLGNAGRTNEFNFSDDVTNCTDCFCLIKSAFYLLRTQMTCWSLKTLLTVEGIGVRLLKKSACLDFPVLMSLQRTGRKGWKYLRYSQY